MPPVVQASCVPGFCRPSGRTEETAFFGRGDGAAFARSLEESNATKKQSAAFDSNLSEGCETGRFDVHMHVALAWILSCSALDLCLRCCNADLRVLQALASPANRRSPNRKSFNDPFCLSKVPSGNVPVTSDLKSKAATPEKWRGP